MLTSELSYPCQLCELLSHGGSDSEGAPCRLPTVPALVLRSGCPVKLPSGSPIGPSMADVGLCSVSIKPFQLVSHRLSVRAADLDIDRQRLVPPLTGFLAPPVRLRGMPQAGQRPAWPARLPVCWQIASEARKCWSAAGWSSVARATVPRPVSASACPSRLPICSQIASEAR